MLGVRALRYRITARAEAWTKAKQKIIQKVLGPRKITTHPSIMTSNHRTAIVRQVVTGMKKKLCSDEDPFSLAQYSTMYNHLVELNIIALGSTANPEHKALLRRVPQWKLPVNTTVSTANTITAPDIGVPESVGLASSVPEEEENEFNLFLEEAAEFKLLLQRKLPAARCWSKISIKKCLTTWCDYNDEMVGNSHAL